MNPPHTPQAGSLGVTKPTGSRSAIACGPISNPGDGSGGTPHSQPKKRRRLGPVARDKLKRRKHLVRCT
jgi:hypothetical protein